MLKVRVIFTEAVSEESVEKYKQIAFEEFEGITNIYKAPGVGGMWVDTIFDSRFAAAQVALWVIDIAETDGYFFQSMEVTY